MNPVSRSGRRRAIGALAIALTGCAALPPQGGDIASSAWAKQSGLHPGPGVSAWSHLGFPGKTPTRFTSVRLDGRATMAVQADASASMLRQQLRIEPDDLGRVHFSWKVPALIDGADLASRDGDDAPVRIVLAFEGDRSRFSPRDAALSELVRALTGEPMPYATLMYVWCNKSEPGTVIDSPRTDRIRRLVVESGPRRLGRWVDYERDVRADYERAFGEKPGALIGIGIMTDSDNTRTHTQAWYGPLRLVPVAAR